jgi:hypothetical protein
MEPDFSLRCSQEPATGPYPESDESSPNTSHTGYLISILILSSHIRLDLVSYILISGFPNFRFATFRVTHIEHVNMKFIVYLKHLFSDNYGLR